MNKTVVKKYLPRIIALTVLALPMITYAAGTEYVLLSPLDTPYLGAPTVNNVEKVSSFAEYAKAVFRIVVGIAGLIAVTILIIGGIEYVSSGISGNEAARSSAHKRIWDAITGLVLALTGWMILYTLNPLLVEFQLKIPLIKGGWSVPGVGGAPGGGTPAPGPTPPAGPTYASLEDAFNNLPPLGPMDSAERGEIMKNREYLKGRLANLRKDFCGIFIDCFEVNIQPTSDPERPLITLRPTDRLNRGINTEAGRSPDAAPLPGDTARRWNPASDDVKYDNHLNAWVVNTAFGYKIQ